MQEQPTKRGPGRPRKAIKEKRQRIEITLSPETIAYLETVPSVSRFIETLIQDYQHSHQHSSKPSP